MLCRNPFISRQGVFGCGQCMPCRITKRREWTHRIMLESVLYADNAFLTLTYSDLTAPMYLDRSNGALLGTLFPPDVQNWLKRFRKLMSPLQFRFFAIGEYGEKTERPHYHVALFGYPTCQYMGSRYKYYKDCCINCDRVRDSWGFGNVHLGTLETNSAGYIAGYVTKKMTSTDDIRLNGRHPEFSRSSNRGGGIGIGMMDEVASEFLALNLDVSEADVPSALRHGSRILPLGRYLKRELRKRVGRSPDAPPSVLQKIELELSPLREAAFNRSASLKEEVIKAADGKVASIEARQKIFKKRGTI